MRNYQHITFMCIRAYMEILKSALVYLEGSLNVVNSMNHDISSME